MAKRFSETKIWEDEWYQALPLDWKIVWKYICDKCDEAGIWKPNLKLADFQIGKKIDWTKAGTYLNNGKERVIITDTGWIIKNFVLFQYGEKVFVSEHGFHKKIRNMLSKYPIDTLSDRVCHTLQEEEEVKEEVKERGMGETFKYLLNPSFERSFNDYLEMRKKIRKPATDRAKQMALTELHKHPVETAIKMLDQSIMNSWQGIFPLKDNIQSKPAASPANTLWKKPDYMRQT